MTGNIQRRERGPSRERGCAGPNRCLLSLSLVLSLLALQVSSVHGNEHSERRLDQIPEPEIEPGTGEETIAPTLTAGPTSSPSLSLHPTVTGAPSFGVLPFAGEPLSDGVTPTTSPRPSHSRPPGGLPEAIDFVDGVDSHEPSMTPTVTPQPSKTFAPSPGPTISASPTNTPLPTRNELDFDDDSCYSTWANLSAAVSSAGNGEVLEICANTTLPLLPWHSPIEFQGGVNLTVTCGPDGKLENQCAIFGGVEQFRLVGSSASVAMKGLTMIGSTHAAVNAMGNETSHLLLKDCELSGHLGVAAVLNYHTETSNITTATDRGHVRRLEVASLSPPIGISSTVELDGCLFHDNIVSYAPIANLGGVTFVTGTIFSGNRGEVGAIGTWFGGQKSVSLSCFIRNSGITSDAMFADEASVVLQESDNYGASSDTPNAICTDLLVTDSSGSSVCQSFTADNCLSPRADPPSNGTIGSRPECISDWEIIYGHASNDTTVDAASPTIIDVCPNTTFDMSQYEQIGLAPLVISSSNFLLQCGSDGSSQNQCTIVGGSRHIEISMNATKVTVKGFNMMNATDISVVVSTSAISEFAVFEDCVWMHNSGKSTVWIESDETVGTDDVPSVSPTFSDAPTVGDGGVGDDVFGDDFFNRDLQIQPQLPVLSISNVYIRASTFLSNTAGNGIVVNTAANLQVSSSIFDYNAVGVGVVAASAGQLNITSSCFHVNEYSDSAGVVVSTSSGGFTMLDTFGSDNIAFLLSGTPQGGCEGVRSGDGTCTSFDASACSLLPPIEDCYSTWDALALSIANATVDQTGGRFTICEDAHLTVNASSAPISIETSDTVVQCGEYGLSMGRCTISGGDIQFQIIGTPTGVEFRGLTFSSAIRASVFTAGGRGGRASFYDCHFVNNTGVATILNYQGAFPSPGMAVEEIPPPADRSMQVSINYCRFASNIVSYAPVTNLRGTVFVENCLFENNSAESGGVGIWGGGGMSLIQSCFEGNVGNKSGAVFVDAASSVATEEDNYGSNSTVSVDGCADLALAGGCESDGVCNGLCVDFNQQTCAAEQPPTFAPSSVPSSQPTSLTSDGCFTDWARLASAIRSTDFSLGLESVYTICADTTLDVSMYPDDSPIVLDAGDVLIQCGEDGRLVNNCTVTGGSSQFRITGTPERITFAGLRFERSTQVAIHAMGSTSSKLGFESCRWAEHTGVAVILVYNEQAGEPYTGQTAIGGLDVPSSESMKASFEVCEFEDNSVSFAVIANIAGTLDVFGSTFTRNTGAQVGAISVSGQALASVGSSSFVENQSDFPGTVFVELGSQISFDSENNFERNRAGTVGECKQIFQETQGSCFEDFICDGVCSEFNVPTSTPTDSPSERPNLLPPSSNLEFAKKASFSGSSQFLTTLLLALFIVLGGVGIYVYLRRKGHTMAIPDVDGTGQAPPSNTEPLVAASDPYDNNNENESAFNSQPDISFQDEPTFDEEDDDDDPFAEEDSISQHR